MAIKQYSKKLEGNQNITEHFKVSEFACHDGSDYIPIDIDLAYKLELIRQHFGKPITITSAYRTPAYNRKIGGASNSYHTKGKAFDIVVKGVEPYDVAHYAQGLWIMGIGCYYDSGFVHIDGRGFPTYWRNQSVTPVRTFGNYPSCDCNVKNVRLVHMADGWSFPQHGITDNGDDEEFRNVLKASVIKKSTAYSNVAKVVQHTVGASEDGYVGDGTVDRIKSWQAAHGLTADGIWGEQCWLTALGLKKKEQPASTPTPVYTYTVDDALIALQVSVGITDVSDEEKRRLDIDGDGKLTENDARLILYRATQK